MIREICCHTPRNISDTTWVISKIIGWSSKIHRGLHCLESVLIRSYSGSYFLAFWNFCEISPITRIHHLYERAQRNVDNNNDTFENFLKKDNSVSIHHKNIRLLGIELYKVKNNLSTHLMSEIFNLRNIDYNLRFQNDFKQDPKNTVNYGLKSLRYLAPKNRNQFLLKLKTRVALQNS